MQAGLYCLAGDRTAALPWWRLLGGGTLVALAVATRLTAVVGVLFLAAAGPGRDRPGWAKRVVLLSLDLGAGAEAVCAAGTVAGGSEGGTLRRCDKMKTVGVNCR